jgi:hypothetical protein
MKMYQHTATVSFTWVDATPGHAAEDQLDVVLGAWSAGEAEIHVEEVSNKVYLASLTNEELLEHAMTFRKEFNILPRPVEGEIRQRKIWGDYFDLFRRTHPHISPGDQVSIVITLTARTVTGTVLSAQNYGNEVEDDWYIELKDAQYGYVYWKQQYDGGVITEHILRPLVEEQ